MILALICQSYSNLRTVHCNPHRKWCTHKTKVIMAILGIGYTIHYLMINTKNYTATPTNYPIKVSSLMETT